MDGWLSCNKARCQTNPVDQCVKQSSWLVDESRWRLKSYDSSIDPSTGTKHRESDYSLLRKLPYWNTGHNLYQANRLSVRVKRLHTPGETTSDSGRIDSGSGRNYSGRNDCKSSQMYLYKSLFSINKLNQNLVSFACSHCGAGLGTCVWFTRRFAEAWVCFIYKGGLCSLKRVCLRRFV